MEIYPLQGIRVLDFGTAFAGPAMGEIMADMGAEVIKIESRARLDGLRIGRPLVGDSLKGDAGQEPELQPIFHSLNRGKLSFTIDFKHPKGLELMKALVKKSDVSNDNYSPGVLDRAGLGYEELKKIKPDIIMCQCSAAGQWGPLREIVAYAPTMTAMAGTTSLNGYYGERVLMTQHAFGDANAAIHAAFAILAALRYRNRTGKGQYIDLAEFETSSACLGEAIMDYTMNQRVQGTQGNRYSGMAPHGNYRCQGDDKWVSIAVKTEEEWRAFCKAIGNPPWTKEERFADSYNRLKNREELDKLVSEWTASRTPTEVTEILQKAGVAAMTVMTIEDQYFDPHFSERQIFVEVEHPVVGTITLPIIPWRLSKTPGKVRRPAPTLGQHNEYVCSEILGMSKEEIAQLTEEKILN